MAEYTIPARKRAEVEASLQAALNRAARKRIPHTLSWTWGAAREETRACEPSAPGARRGIDGRFERPVLVVPLTIIGETPQYAGWRFVAALAHIENETVVRTLPGETCPSHYATRGAVCDHCRAARRRNDTFVVRHDDGRTVQVGRTCLGDFLGSDAALDVARAAELSLYLDGIARAGEDDSDGGGGGGGRAECYLPTYLAHVALIVRRHGWVSRKASQETGNPPTSSVAWDAMLEACHNPRMAGPADEDRALAQAAIAWAEELSDEQVEGDDYLRNLRAIARVMLVDTRIMGYAASMIAAYKRATTPKPEKAPPMGHIGTIGQALTWGLPPKVGKRGQPLKGAPIVASSAPVQLVRKVGFETQWGWSSICIFRATEGHCLVWRTSSPGFSDTDEGSWFTLAGTVKEHGDYQGRPQTVLTRCTATKVEQAKTA